MNLQPGEVWLADLGLAVKTRPVVIVSRHDTEPPRALAIRSIIWGNHAFSDPDQTVLRSLI